MKALAVAAGVLIAVSVTQAASAAPHDDFHNKWPWHWPPSSASINTLPFQGVHGCQPGGECVAAYDFGIADDHVMSAAEGQVTGLVSGVTQCGSNLHYGNFVDVDGKRYAHLVAPAPSVVLGANLFQGDAIGTQGHTGNVQPCDNQDPQSGKHLHWEFMGASAVPAKIDGTDTGPLAVGGYPESSNSVVGEFSTPGATLRTYYQAHGGFNSIGWTTKHCPGTCTLDMTANNHWGRMQDFRHDPDWFGQEFATILAAKWNLVNDEAYRADSVFWPAWAGGAYDHLGILRALSMPQNEAGACPSGSNPACVSYQRFHLGYVWLASNGVASASFCPDVFPLPKGDGAVRANDAQWIFSLWQNHAYDWRGDINGDGGIGSAEAQFVFGEYKAGVGACYP